MLASQSCWLANIMTMMSESFPREHLATYAAIAGIGGSLGGPFSPATLLAGQVIQCRRLCAGLYRPRLPPPGGLPVSARRFRE